MSVFAAILLTCGWFKEIDLNHTPGHLGDYYSGAVHVCGGTVRGRILYKGRRQFMAGSIEMAPEIKIEGVK